MIEARVEDRKSGAPSESVRIAVIDRAEEDLEQLGLTLVDGRDVLSAIQAVVVSQQAARYLGTKDYCCRCYTPFPHKDRRSIVVRTVFGKVRLESPRFWSCSCDSSDGARRRTFSPVSEQLQKRVTPELEYLQVKWAAHLPYATSTRLLKEVLPLNDCIMVCHGPGAGWVGGSSTFSKAGDVS